MPFVSRKQGVFCLFGLMWSGKSTSGAGGVYSTHRFCVRENVTTPGEGCGGGSKLQNVHPRFCDWPKQARCKAREVQVYAHTANLRNAADCPFSTIPKGLRIGCFSLQKWLSHFGAKDGQPHCVSTCLCAARYKPANSQTQNLGSLGNGSGTSFAGSRPGEGGCAVHLPHFSWS